MNANSTITGNGIASAELHGATGILIWAAGKARLATDYSAIRALWVEAVHAAGYDNDAEQLDRIERLIHELAERRDGRGNNVIILPTDCEDMNELTGRALVESIAGYMGLELTATHDGRSWKILGIDADGDTVCVRAHSVSLATALSIANRNYTFRVGA